jgi:hypothetical protein
MVDWKHWPTDGRWTADVWGFGLCVARIDDSGYYRYALYDSDVEQTAPIRIGFCATLDDAQTQAEQFAVLHLVSADG